MRKSATGAVVFFLDASAWVTPDTGEKQPVAALYGLIGFKSALVSKPVLCTINKTPFQGSGATGTNGRSLNSTVCV
jgi:hypothetical protein